MSEQMKTLQKYVGDMLGLEKHIYQAIKRQSEDKDMEKLPEAHGFVRQVESVINRHVTVLENHLNALGGSISAPVKDTVSSALGVAAGIIDMVRQNDKISVNLRDDYTALNLAAVSYTMLHTTGLAMQHQGTADLARDHLMELTPLITRINEMMPRVVAHELRDEGAIFSNTISQQAIENTQKAWSSDHIHAGHPHA